ncbi:MAG: PD-(D/E)XK nuclease family protein [Akkermansiaceae bacterium]
MPATREFLSWDRPFGAAAIDWLWERKDQLAEMLIVVPTAQSGRRLREQLAERGALLGPRVVTTGFLMRPDDFAPESVELLAWCEVLEKIEDWDRYSAIFPISPSQGDAAGWALGLAKSLVGVRTSLQEAGLLLSSAAKRMDESVEAERWEALADLESVVERRLEQLGFASKNAQLARAAVTFPEDVTKVVVAGVLDLPPVSERILTESKLEITILLTGEDEADFDDWGRPVKTKLTLEGAVERIGWEDREISWPEKGSVELTGDPGQQAALALSKIAETGSSSAEVALGTGDEEVSGELVRTFGRSGWTVHDPGAGHPSPLAGWLGCWRSYLRKEGVAEVVDLLAFSQSGVMAKGQRGLRTSALSQLRDQFLVSSSDDVSRAQALITEEIARSPEGSKKARLEGNLKNANLAKETMENLAEWRKPFLGRSFHAAMRSLLKVIDPEDQAGIFEWLDETASVAKEVKRSPGFWLELLLSSLGSVSDPVPEGRVLDVQGWLELLHDPAPHLVICGMNEGKVPGKASTDSWLPEATRAQFGLAHDQARAARDAYILTALLKTREASGRVDLIVGKSSGSGDMLMPSRLLLAAKGQDLARRVEQLFEEIEPSDSGLAWTLEDHWKWRPREKTPKERMSVTAIAKYLACPFRYYLSQVIRMNQPEPERAEWNHRDFGTVMHDVLERWGLDESARDLDDVKAIEKWVHQSLDEVVAARFGEALPLAVCIQSEAMQQRLTWFAEAQAKERQAGWRVVEVEKDFSITIEGVTLTGQVDRIDHHEDGRVRVLDYKTSKKAKKVIEEHIKNLPKEPPVHLEGVDEVLTPAGKLWTNVQVPFYAAALERVDAVGYFALGETETDVKISLWDEFDEEEQESAVRCAEWVLKQVKKQVFWPPAEKPRYDDFGGLAYGRLLEKAVEWQGGAA